jgi:hypothetical protein
MLRAVRAVLHGPITGKWDAIVDAAPFRRKLPFALLLAALMVFGFFPSLLVNKIQPDAQRIVARATTSVSASPATIADALDFDLKTVAFHNEFAKPIMVDSPASELREY